ncbi:TonB-dependent receptor [Porticoccus sp. W117]|uniref:TonB-dependent receptor n=1 Tax=Porticoccus sp. W117 TaxID=3054777 RepID=UPI0025919A39|nr:TonB-dependent receptor [Porticoccus sp. W117]MDM3870346.1 TonB-dependent receptor [Porticoccus sp. W117]
MSAHALAGADDKVQIDIKSQKAGSALVKLGAMTGTQITVPQSVSDTLLVAGVKGDYTLREALNLMLKDSGLTYQFVSENDVNIEAPESEVAGDGKLGKKIEVSEEVVITGSQLLTSPGELDRQVTTFSREDIDRTGATTFAEFMRSLPQNLDAPSENGAGFAGSFGGAQNFFGAAGVNLRGLGERGTLVLVNGRRTARGGVFGDVVDITKFPIAQIERVELILDGASSIYGADAVGGVVNIITRKDYEGVALNVTHVSPADAGGEQTTVSVAGTFSWGSGSLTTTYQYFKQEDVLGDQRDNRFRTRPDSLGLLPSGSPGNIEAGSVFTSNGNVTFPLYALDANGNAVAADDPSAVPGTEVFRAQLPVSSGGTLSLQDFVGRDPVAGELAEAGLSLIPGREQHSIRFDLTQQITDTINLSADLSYAPGDTMSFESNQVLQFNTQGLDIGGANTLNPFPGRQVIRAEFPFLPDAQRFTDKEDISFTFRFDGKISESWNWALDGTYSNSDNQGERRDFLSRSIDFFLTNPDSTSDRNPFRDLANPPNVFLSPLLGFESEQALREGILTDSARTASDNTDKSLELTVNGDLFALPAGTVRSLWGIGTREEENDLFDESGTLTTSDNINPFSFNQIFGLNFEQNLRRTTDFVKGELHIPVLEDLPLIKSMDIILSGRYEEVTSFGFEQVDEDNPDQIIPRNIDDSESSWSLGLVWRPVDWMQLRANKNTSYSLPGVSQYVLPTRLLSSSIFFRDDDGNFQRFPTRRIDGGNPELGPEQNETVSIGLNINHPALPELMFDLNLHSNKLTERFGSYPGAFFNHPDQLFEFGPGRPDWTFDEASGFWVQDQRLFNLGRTATKGLDLNLSYNVLETAVGDFDANLNYGYLGKADSVRVAGECFNCSDFSVASRTAVVNRVERVAFIDPDAMTEAPFTAIPQHTARFRLGWEYGAVRADITKTYASSTVKEIRRFTDDGPVSGTSVVNPANEVTLAVRYDFDRMESAPEWLQGTVLGLNIPNLFNDQSEFILTPTIESQDNLGNFDSILSRPRGRAFTLTLQKNLEI